MGQDKLIFKYYTIPIDHVMKFYSLCKQKMNLKRLKSFLLIVK